MGMREALDNAKVVYGARQAVYRAIEFPTKFDQRWLHARTGAGSYGRVRLAI